MSNEIPPVDSRETVTVNVSHEAVQERLDTLMIRCHADGHEDTTDYTPRTKEAAFALLEIIEALRIAVEDARSSATARDELLRELKNVFAGEAAPHWINSFQTTCMRGEWLDRIDLMLMEAK